MNNNSTIKQNQGDFIQVDLQKWLFKLLSYWWLFGLFLALSLAAGYFYLRYATYLYSSRAVLLIKETDNSGLISEESILLDKGFTGTGKSLVNEIEILKSQPLMQKVVEQLNIQISFFHQGRIKEREYYKPVSFDIEEYILKGRRTSFFLSTLNNESFLLKSSMEDEGTSYNYGEPFQCEYGYFKINPVDTNFFIPGTFRVVINAEENVASYYAAQLVVERIGDPNQSSILQLKLNDPIPEKAKDILNALIENYNKEDINDENQVLRNTLDFIDNRVKILTQELNLIEGDIERFKSRNAIISESAASSMSFTLDEIRNSMQELNQYDVRKSILISLEDFLENEHELFELIPINLGGENPTLTALIIEYNNQVLERDKLITTASLENPSRKRLEQRMLSNRILIGETLKNLLKDIDIPIEKLKENIEQLEGSLVTIPNIDKNLLEQTRMQKIKEELFLFLLKKREETALSEAVATASTRTIEPPKSSRSPIYPRTRLIYLACILLGLLIPLVLITAYSLFDNKVSSEDTVRQMVSIPIFGRVLRSKSKDHIVIKAQKKSVISELFKQLWTNLNYLGLKEDRKVLAVTSSISDEGKTFVASNLAITIALTGKKVALLELDLRRPKFNEYFNLNDYSRGVTSYLIGEKELEETVQAHPEHENLHIFSSGPIPPNPYELIISDKMKALIQELKIHYDFIIIDTPPINLVSDALVLRESIDHMLIIIRAKHTRTFMLRTLEEMYQEGELPGSGLVLNGFKSSNHTSSYIGKYGRGYYS